jgi:hypothetical protein
VTSPAFAGYNGTAPIEVSSGPRKIYRLSRRGNRRLNHAIHMAAVTQIRHRNSPGRPTTTANEPRARRAKKPSAHSSAVSATSSTPPCSSTPARQLLRAREGKRGTTLDPARPAHTPTHRLFGQATPGPAPTLRLAAAAPPPTGESPAAPLDKQRGLVPGGFRDCSIPNMANAYRQSVTGTWCARTHQSAPLSGVLAMGRAPAQSPR